MLKYDTANIIKMEGSPSISMKFRNKTLMLTPSIHVKQSKKHDGKQIENEKVKIFLLTHMILYM